LPPDDVIGTVPENILLQKSTVIINKTQVGIEKKKDKYGIEYSPASASDGACTRGWGGGMLKMESLTSDFPL